jgi:hypothetical protein
MSNKLADKQWQVIEKTLNDLKTTDDCPKIMSLIPIFTRL